MGNQFSCHQPCCRWTTDADGELAVEAKRLGKHGEEEPKMNFDTNVLGPANVNLIGGGSAAQQELKLFEDSRFSRPAPRDASREGKGISKGMSPSRAKVTSAERMEEPLPVASASFKPISPKKDQNPTDARSSRTPTTQSAKQFADSFSRVLRNDHSIKPRAPDLRTLPQETWSKLHAAFPVAKAAKAAKAEAKAEVQEAKKVAVRAVHSVMPALWSSFHRQWTGQKASAIVPTAPEAPAAPVAPMVVVAEKIAKTSLSSSLVSVLSSVSPALWSPVHRKWCGQEALAPAVAKLVAARDLGLLPNLASSMLDAALSIPKMKDMKVDKEAKHAIKPSLAPALFSKWHGRWTAQKV